MPSTSNEARNRAGEVRLERRWIVAEPRAAVLLVHGIAEHSGRYEHVGDALADRGYDVASFDLRGHGGSEGRRGHVDSFDDFLDDVEDLIAERRTLGVPVVLIGHSLGGLICATYLVRGRPAPDLLVLSAPALTADVPGWQRALAPYISKVLPTLALPNDLDGALLSRDEQVGIAYRDDPMRLRKATARLGHETFAAMQDTTAHVERITVPTYVLHGSQDRLVPPSASEPLAVLPNVTRVVLPGVRHEAFNEPERDEVIAGVAAWIDARLAERPDPG